MSHINIEVYGFNTLTFTNSILFRLENVTLNYGPLSNDKNQNGVRSVIYRARAREIDMTPHDSQGFDNVKGLFVFGTPRELALGDENIIPHQTTTSALCVEIVGTHFLDKMVRIIVVRKQE